MELPELTILSGQMAKEITGKRISEAEVKNHKCLNMALKEFRESLLDKTVKSVENRGKWIFIGVEPDSILLFNPGMGVDILYFKPEDSMPDKYHIKVVFGDRTGFTVRVWWFCYLHLVSEAELKEHKVAGRLGVNPLDDGFDLEEFQRLVEKGRGNVKSFLMDQKNIAGIGNVYIQDILFNAKVHPLRRVSSLSQHEVEALYESMKMVLKESIGLGGLAYEKDFYGRKGGYGVEHFKIAYKEGRPCPECGETIMKIRTGSTSSFVCLKCQPIL